MKNFKEKLARFMYGRYGADQLYYASIVLYLVLALVYSFFHNPVINILMWAVLIWMVFRSFSRNVYKRRRENEVFMKFWNPVRAKFSLTFRRIREIKTHRFRRCPSCKKELRLPKKRGKHTVTCPCCHNEFEVHILL